jgi:glutamate formiminotransferase
MGPSGIDMRHGVAAIGASPWVTNLNVPLATSDLRAARRIARSVSARGGGLPAVEAMALPHAEGAAHMPLPYWRCCPDGWGLHSM